MSQVVEGDLVRLGPGDQVIADGPLRAGSGLYVDESILTGETQPVARSAGDEVRSGSFVVEGTGSFEVAAVGPDSYAERIAGNRPGSSAIRAPRSSSRSTGSSTCCSR